MTKSKMVGRGGARAGSGRKRKPVAASTCVSSELSSEQELSSEDVRGPIIPANLSTEDLKKSCETLAYETLATVAVTGTSETARVAASRELLDRSLGKPKPGVAKPDSPDLFDDHWGALLKPPSSPPAGRSN